jgi:hypothetical protein
MKNFNEQFKQLLSLYPSDSSCVRALNLIETVVAPAQPDPDDVWDEDRVRRFIKGLKQVVKKRNAYFGYLLEQIKIIVVNPKSKTFKTMAVDKNNNLYINPEFASELIEGIEPPAYDEKTVETIETRNKADNNDDVYNTLPTGEKMFLGIIAHELMHIFKNHVARMGDRRKMVKFGSTTCTLWNIATDIEINDELLYRWGYYLTANGIITNPDGTYEMNKKLYQCRNITPERIYAMLDADIAPAAPETINVGDIVYDKVQNKYGEVVSISPDGKVKLGELTREEAKARV